MRMTSYAVRPGIDPATVAHFTHGFELYQGDPVNMTIRETMNQFIHSHHFSPFVPVGSKMMGIYFASDWKKKSALLYVTVSTLAQAFRAVADDPVN